MRKVLQAILCVLFISGVAFAECPPADFSGDCVVNLEDFAMMASDWLGEGVMPYSGLSRDYVAGVESDMSTANIYSSDGNEFMSGTYFVYKTNAGRFGKFMVENYEPSENHRLTIRWVTYNPDGSVYSQGRGLVIRGTWSCDLDEGLETNTGRDWMWDMLTSSTRRLNPKNGAKFKLMHRAIAPVGMVWVYVEDPGVYSHELFNGYMSKYETTNGQYSEYLNSALADGLITVYNDVVYAAGDTTHIEPYFNTYAANSNSQITYSGGVFSVRTRDGYDMSDHPVVMVSWYGAMAFADYYGWRLPTEWEWQAVADYDGSYTYGCGTTINQSKANYQDSDYANPLNLSSVPYTSPVGYYPAYGYGMCDMAGNVWEWTDSCYYGDCHRNKRLLRSGGWDDSDGNCEVSSRYGEGLDQTNNGYYGFRVCR